VNAPLPEARSSSVLAAFAVAAATTTIAFAHGGYFPTEWGWALFAFALVCLLELVLRRDIRAGRLELLAVTAMFGFTGWTFLSAAWSVSAAQPVLSGERVLVYAAAIPAAILLARSAREAAALVLGVLAAAVFICGYALSTRVFPGSIVSFPPVDGYQLQEPIGYWNGLAAIAGIGALVAVGLAAEARTRWLRIAAGAALPVLLVALYLTFSRGGMLALAFGACAALVFTPRRLHLLVTMVVCGVVPAAAVALVSRLTAVTQAGASLDAARADGWKLGAVLAGSIAAGAAAGWVLPELERRVDVPARGRRAVGAAIVLLVAGAAALFVIHEGGPVSLAHRVSAAYNRSLPPTGTDLGRRLTSLSSDGRSDYWHVAWLEVSANPWLGGGAGSWERFWHLYRPTSYEAQNAHNLYLETLAELGPVGLALLVVVLATPFVAAWRMRGAPVVTPAAGAMAAFVVHAGVDWDFQIVAVTLAGLFCGAALLVAARTSRPPRPLPTWARCALLAGAAVLILAAVGMQVGSSALGHGSSALDRGNLARALGDGERARRWQPWSYQPYQLLGQAYLAAGRRADARRSFRRAIALDRANWSLWYDLAQASAGRARSAALAQAARWNPNGPGLQAPRTPG
jgi:hypothetical protein